MPFTTGISSYLVIYSANTFHPRIALLNAANEKPVPLNFNGSGPGFENNIRTGTEPTGEGE